MNAFKKILIVLLLTVSLTAFAQPVSAQEITQDCSRVVQMQTRFNNESAKFIQRTHDSHHARNIQLLRQRDMRETQLFTQLDRNEVFLQKEFDTLRNRVKTGEQSEAVESYIGNVSGAQGDRRGKITDAVVNYRNGTDTVIIERWTKLESTYFQAEADIAAAGERAVADCESGTAVRDVTLSFNSDIRAIKEQRRVTLLELRDFDVTLRDLRRERDVTVIDANREFMATQRDLRSGLRGIFSITR